MVLRRSHWDQCEMADSSEKLLANSCGGGGLLPGSPAGRANGLRAPAPLGSPLLVSRYTAPPLGERLASAAAAAAAAAATGGGSTFVRLNVGGKIFVTRRTTLEKVSGTRLSNLQETDPNYDRAAGEWFYDRNPSLFNFILDYFRNDELHFPHNFCGPTIRRELDYWRLDEMFISPCCWNHYRRFEEDKRIFDHIEQAFQSKTLSECLLTPEVVSDPTSKWVIWRRRIYLCLEEPMSSRVAKIWTTFFLALVLTSIGCLCLESHRMMRVPLLDQERVARQTANETNPKLILILSTETHPILQYIDTFCTCFFTIEFLVRLIVAPNRLKFCRSVMNIIDVLCVLPMWINYIMKLNGVLMTRELLPLWFAIMMLRVLRICRVLRLARHYTAVKILMLALKASVRELLMLLIFVFIVVLIFAVVVYYAEFFQPDTFFSIPDGYWWAIITLTTVGYGDMYPKSPSGYIVGALCALTGILATGLPVPIIANNFNLYYGHAQLKDALDNNRRLQSERRRQQELATVVLTSEPASDNELTVAIKEDTV